MKKKFYVPVSASPDLSEAAIVDCFRDAGILTSKRDVLSHIANEMYDAKHEGIDDLAHGYITITIKKVTTVSVTKPDGERGKVRYLSRKKKKFRLKKV